MNPAISGSSRASGDQPDTALDTQGITLTIVDDTEWMSIAGGVLLNSLGSPSLGWATLALLVVAPDLYPGSVEPENRRGVEPEPARPQPLSEPPEGALASGRGIRLEHQPADDPQCKE